MLAPLLLLLSTVCAFAADSYIFTSFRGNGEDGVYFAVSDDGAHWSPLNENKPWLKPGHAGMLMRDPCIALGPDGVYRMVWTSSWGKTDGQVRIGYAASRDLVHWSEQKLIAVMPDEPDAVNAWAPELLWDREKKEWIVLWASTIPGRFAATDHETERPDRNHRIYATATKDFETFSKARLFFDPGFNVIDSTVVADGERYVMVFKDERVNPVKKNLRLAVAEHAGGPYRLVGEAFTRAWVEGPTMVRAGSDWWLYFDSYRKPQHYEALRSSDLKEWKPMDVEFPADHRHGTVIRVSRAVADELRRVRM